MVDFTAMKAAANAKVAQEKLGLNIPSKIPASSALALPSKYLTELELIDEAIEYEDDISEWESKFLKSIRGYIVCKYDKEKPLSPKQRGVLLKLCVRLNIEMERAPSQLRSPPAPTLSSYARTQERFAPSYNAPDDMDDDIPF